MKFNNRWFILAFILLIGIGGGFYYFFINQNQSQEIPAEITTEAIRRETISGMVGATGKVRPNQIVNLTWQTTGTVGEVFKPDNTAVNTGDLLVNLDVDSFQPALLQAEQSLPAAQRALEDLLKSDLKRTQAMQTLADARKAYQTALDDRVIKNERNTSDSKLLAAEASYLTAKSNLDTIEKFFSFVQDKPEDDLTRAQATAQLSLARKNYDWASWNYEWAKSKPLPEDVLISEANLQVAKSKLDDAERDWEKVKDKPDPDDITAARSKVDALKAQIDLSIIKAPFDGTVTNMAAQTGDLVKPGTFAVQITDLSRLFLDIPISEIDINKIKLGQEIQLTFDAIQDKTYQGKVTEIAKIGESIQQVIYYTVTCEISNNDELVKPGMTAAAMIQVSKAENVITVPNNAIRTDGISRYVTIVQDGLLVIIPVELGLIADVRSEVAKGDLQVGDLVVTNPQLLPTQGPTQQ